MQLLNVWFGALACGEAAAASQIPTAVSHWCAPLPLSLLRLPLLPLLLPLRLLLLLRLLRWVEKVVCSPANMIFAAPPGCCRQSKTQQDSYFEQQGQGCRTQLWGVVGSVGGSGVM
jgi:hypothetical protein